MSLKSMSASAIQVSTLRKVAANLDWLNTEQILDYGSKEDAKITRYLLRKIKEAVERKTMEMGS